MKELLSYWLAETLADITIFSASCTLVAMTGWLVFCFVDDIRKMKESKERKSNMKESWEKAERVLKADKVYCASRTHGGDFKVKKFKARCVVLYPNSKFLVEGAIFEGHPPIELKLECVGLTEKEALDFIREDYINDLKRSKEVIEEKLRKLEEDKPLSDGQKGEEL